MIRSLLSNNSIKLKLGSITLSRLWVDSQSRVNVHLFGLRIFQAPLQDLLNTPRAHALVASIVQQHVDACRQAVLAEAAARQVVARKEEEQRLRDLPPEQRFDLFPDYFKTLLRLQAWNIIAKNSHRSVEEKAEQS